MSLVVKKNDVKPHTGFDTWLPASLATRLVISKIYQPETQLVSLDQFPSRSSYLNPKHTNLPLNVLARSFKMIKNSTNASSARRSCKAMCKALQHSGKRRVWDLVMFTIDMQDNKRRHKLDERLLPSFLVLSLKFELYYFFNQL